MHTPITIDALRVIDAIDRKKSFAAAANELYRVPSAISYTVQKLEEDLGVAIFNRSGHRATLTPAGRYLLEQGREILRAADTLSQTTRQIASGWEPRITLAINTLLPIASLYPAVKEFQELQPQVEVQILEEVFGGAWDALMCKRADLIIGCDTDSRPAGNFTLHAMGTMDFVYAAAPHHPACKDRAPLNSDTLANYRAVVAADSSRHLAPRSGGVFERQRRLTVPNMAAKIEAQRLGLGLGFLPRHQVTHLLERGELVELTLEQPRKPLTLNIAHRSEDRGRAIKWFMKRFADSLYFKEWLSPISMPEVIFES
jgi:DNA-binding transcriptional LysR family regulator